MSKKNKWLYIRVTDMKTGKSKTNVKIPAALADFGMKMATRYAPDSVEGLDLNQVSAAIKTGGEEKLVDVEDVEKNEHVEIFVK